MNTHVENTSERKTALQVRTVDVNKLGTEATFRLADNRLETQEAGQLKSMADDYVSKQFAPIPKKVNKTGLPDNLKSGIEHLSGYAMDDVKVHYNSDRPAQLNAHAYAQGTDIHLASGQEKHLPHEAWHVVQQKQGRVKPTLQMKSDVKINDDVGLEKEADVMGAMANESFTTKSMNSNITISSQRKETLVMQMRLSKETWNGPQMELPVFIAAKGQIDLPIQFAKGKIKQSTGIPSPKLKPGDTIEYERVNDLITISSINGEPVDLSFPSFVIQRHIEVLPDSQEESREAVVKESPETNRKTSNLLRRKSSLKSINTTSKSQSLTSHATMDINMSAEEMDISEVTSSEKEGKIGVWFMCNPKQGTVVIKNDPQAVRQAIATRWLRYMGINCPNVRVISRASAEGQLFVDKCRLYEGNKKKLEKESTVKCLQVMEFVKGRCVTAMSQMNGADVIALNSEKNQFNIGRLTVCDVLLRNPDRFRLETEAGLHTGNLMFTEEGNQLVAIDNEMLLANEAYLNFVQRFVEDILSNKMHYANLVCKYLTAATSGSESMKSEPETKSKNIGLDRLRRFQALDNQGVDEVSIRPEQIQRGMLEMVNAIVGIQGEILHLLRGFHAELLPKDVNIEEDVKLNAIIESVRATALLIAKIHKVANQKM